MKLFSCENCGVVLDGDSIIFPQIEDENGYTVDAVYDHYTESFKSSIECPVCKERVMEP